MGQWWRDNIMDDGRLPMLILFLSFVITFLVTRIITRMIRAGVGPFRNNVRDGVHIHHSVPGIILLIVGAFSAVGSEHLVWRCVSAALIGMGTSLVLDEFALILHLEDVYWTDEGRSSVEMVSLAAACLGFALVGMAPFGDNELDGAEGTVRMSGLVFLVLMFASVLICVLKGKYRMALVGCFVPLIGWIGAVRMARPSSLWARRYYSEKRLAHAERRAQDYDDRLYPPLRKLSDIIAGSPSPAKAGVGPVAPATPAAAASPGGTAPPVSADAPAKSSTPPTNSA